MKKALILLISMILLSGQQVFCVDFKNTKTVRLKDLKKLEKNVFIVDKKNIDIFFKDKAKNIAKTKPKQKLKIKKIKKDFAGVFLKKLKKASFLDALELYKKNLTNFDFKTRKQSCNILLNKAKLIPDVDFLFFEKDLNSNNIEKIIKGFKNG